MSAHDELEQLLADHGLDPDTAEELAKAVAEWAKGQDEDWPWDDGTPDPPTIDYSDPEYAHLVDPEWLAGKLAQFVEAQERFRSQFLRERGSPAVFQQVTHVELGPPLEDTTRALAAHWAQVDWSVRTPSVVPWQPRVRICPERSA